MEKEVLQQFIGKHVKLEKRSINLNFPSRTTFKIFCTIKDVTENSVIIFTDHTGAISLVDIVGIEERPRNFMVKIERK